MEGLRILGGRRGSGRLLYRVKVGGGLAGHVIKQPQRAIVPRLRGQSGDQPPCGRLGKFGYRLKVLGLEGGEGVIRGCVFGVPGFFVLCFVLCVDLRMGLFGQRRYRQ